jgi:hypothetical protein
MESALARFGPTTPKPSRAKLPTRHDPDRTPAPSIPLSPSTRERLRFRFWSQGLLSSSPSSIGDSERRSTSYQAARMSELVVRSEGAGWPTIRAWKQRVKNSRTFLPCCRHVATTLRGAGYPRPAQDSLPAAGQALPGGLSTRRVPLKGFRGRSPTSHPPFPSFLPQSDRPKPAKLLRCLRTEARNAARGS